MTTVTALINRVRSELGDPPQPFRTSVMCDGQTSWFDLPKQQIIQGSELVEVQQGASLTPLTTPAGYTMNYQLGQLQLVTPPANGALLIVNGDCWAMFSNVDLIQYISDAANEHLAGRTVTERYQNRFGWITYRDTQMTLANLPPIEEPLVAMWATVQALWTLANDAASDPNIQTAEGTVIDRSARYQQVMNQISAMTERYQELCSQLNVGVFKVEQFQIRRVSYGTGRLVPVFKEREFDDHRWPSRELPPIDGRYEDDSGIPSPVWNSWGP